MRERDYLHGGTVVFDLGVTALKPRSNWLEEEHYADQRVMPCDLSVNSGSANPSDGVSASITGTLVRDLAAIGAVEMVAREIGLLCAGPIGGLVAWGIVTGVGTVLTCRDVDSKKGPTWFYGTADTS